MIILVVQMHMYFLTTGFQKVFSKTHIDEIFAETFLEVTEEGCLCGFIQEDKILDSNAVPGSQGALHVRLTLCNKLYQP